MKPMQPTDPERIGRYRLVGRLGSGGMGRVYLGETPEGLLAAVKVIRDDLAGDTGFRARFRREVSAAVSVAGLFTARVIDADPDGEPPWLATEYVDGPSLRAAVAERGPLGGPGLVALAQGLADALGSIHAAGLVHRDLKPANVLLSPAGPRVIDFGIARSTTSTQVTGTGEMIGTPEFMAPEQVAGGEVGPAADVFALGSTVAFAATGRSPFAADQAAASLYRIVSTDPDLDGVPADVRELILPCFAKDPAARPTAQQLAQWLRSTDAPPTAPIPVQPTATPIAPAYLTGAETVAPRPPEASAHRRTAVLVATGAAVVLVAGGVTAVVLTSGSGAPPAPVVTTSAAPAKLDPNDPKVRYVDRLCSSGKLLTGLADVLAPTPVTSDPAVAKAAFLSEMDKVIGTVDAALADFVPLRDEAPTDDVRAGFTRIVTEFTNARAAFAEARAQVSASEPLEVSVYSAAVDTSLDGVRDLSFAATVQKGLTLPKEYTAAADSAPHCT